MITAVLYSFFIILFAAAGVAMVSMGLPGTFVAWGGIFAGSLVTEFRFLSLRLLALFLLLLLSGELLEYVSGVIGAKKFGASNRAVIGAVVGGLAGAVALSLIVPVIGTVTGMLVGTFAGAFLAEYTVNRDIIASGRSGWGAFLGRIAAIFIKVFIIFLMSFMSVMRVFTAL